jgi:DNA-binding HxlR family transcriptional regulator
LRVATRFLQTRTGAGFAAMRIARCCPQQSNLHHDSDILYDAVMQRKSFRVTPCPIARSLERVGEWWSMLIMRDALHGLTRFDAFQDSLGIAPNMLARRLKALVAAGLLERRAYSVRPPRYEYVPTERGRDFRAVLITLLAFGNRHFAPEGKSVTIVDAQTGAEADPVVVDRATGKPIREPEFAWAPGPAAGEHTKRRYARRESVSAGSKGVQPAPALPGPGGTKKKSGRDARTLPGNKPHRAARPPRNRSAKAR